MGIVLSDVGIFNHSNLKLKVKQMKINYLVLHNKKERISIIKKKLVLCLLACLIGISVGLLDAFFGRILLGITAFRDAHVLWLIPFLAVGGFLTIFLYQKFGSECMQGMRLVFSVGHHEKEKIPFRLIPLVMLSTWITHLLGGSAGREGVAVQIGATISSAVESKTKIASRREMIVIGMAAGFSGLFQTPAAAAFFALEVLTIGKLEYSVLIPVLITSYTASFTAHLCGLEKFTVVLQDTLNFTPNVLIKLVVCGILFGLVGATFAQGLKYTKSFFSEKIKNPYIKITTLGCIISICILLFGIGRYAGLGTNLIGASFSGQTIYGWDWALKLVITILTLAAGFQGGEVTPIFSIGASLGCVLGSIMGLPSMMIAALGYAAVFGSATNTFLAPVLIGAEVFGFTYLPYFLVVCAIARVFSGNASIYGKQKTLE